MGLSRTLRKPDRRRLAGAFLSILVVAPLLLGAGGTAVRPAVTEVGAGTAALYAQAAAALRRHDCSGANAVLAPLIAARGGETRFARLVAGLYAHACEEVREAEERLYAAADPAGVLEDWRLFLLADSARARGHVLVARAALAKLLGDYPASPLRPRALLEAATFAWEQGDKTRALALIDQARREGLRSGEADKLEALGWEIGTRLGDAEVRGEAARHLLIDAPALAVQMGVSEILHGPNGEVPWPGLLNADQLKRRAQSLLALQLEPSALATLDAVGAAERDLDWHLLAAQALVRLHRGGEAVALLAPLTAAGGQQEAALEWARAAAAADLATAQRGRANLPVAERQDLRLAAQQHLRKVVAIGADPALAVKALRLIYAELVERDLFELAIDTLRRLRALDPADTTGANHLWGRGWQEYSRRNYSGAIGYWTELNGLYPRDPVGRRGRYWTARAFEALGERARSRQIYLEVAGADTDDFYRRNALARLGHKSAPAVGDPAAAAATAAQRVIEPWPTDPALVRARLLSDLGLDDLALAEMELVKEHGGQSRAASALEALVLARKGEPRKSVQAIREAFPALGGPFQANLPEEALQLYYPLAYQEPIRTWSALHHVPAHLVYAIIRQESAFDANARSAAGARGLMQLMPGTARELARWLGLSYSSDRMVDPSFNVAVGTAYLHQVLGMFGNNLELALAGYNGGPYRIKRLWREARTRDLDRFLEGLTIEESKIYVKRILVLADSYRQLYPKAG